MTERTFYTANEEETVLLGRRVGEKLFPGAFVALYGELGAGKTAFVRGVGLAFHAEHIASPTFLIVEEHDTEPRLFHFDVYRLGSEEELFAIGFDDYLSAGGVIVMEWAELVSGALPGERLDITLSYHEAGRKLLMHSLGEKYEGLVRDL